MRTKLTGRLVARLREPGTVAYPTDFFDAHVSGLCLTVRPSGSASWCLRYRFKGEQRRLTLGKSPGLSIEAARKAAQHYLAQIALGRDPAAEKQEARRPPSAGDCYPAFAEQFIRQHAIPNNRSWAEAARVLGLRADRGATQVTFTPIYKSLASQWSDRRIKDISRQDVSRAVQELVARNKLASANARLAHLKSMFSWLRAQGHIDVHPCDTLPMPARPGKRSRYLEDHELALVWTASGRLAPPFRAFVRLMILTGQRRGEVAGLSWDEVDGVVWTLPAARSKNGIENVVPLSALALTELALLPRRGPHVLTTDDEGATSISNFSGVKESLVSAMNAIDPIELEPWTFHDLRRSASTGMARLGVQPHIVEAILNHTTGGSISDLARIYNRHTYAAEKRAALNLWGDHIAQLANRYSRA